MFASVVIGKRDNFGFGFTVLCVEVVCGTRRSKKKDFFALSRAPIFRVHLAREEENDYSAD